MVLELLRLRKILAKDKKAMQEPLRLLIGYLTRTPEEVLSIYLKNRFSGAKINAGS